MAEFALKTDENELKAIWKTVFNDTEIFIDLYFKYYFAPNNTLIYRKQGKIVSMLFMIPYEFRFWGKTVQCYYLAGLATLPEFRRRGIMQYLLNFSNKIMKERNIPLAILIPANEKMYGFYQKFDFEQVFQSNDEIIPLENLIEQNNSLSESYAEFDKIYREKDFCIQKEFTDFQAIIEEWEYENRSPKTNVAGMAKLIAPHFLFNIFKQATGRFFKLNFEKNYEVILERKILTVNNRMLCRLIFGFRTSELSPEIAAIFPEHKPILNFMLE